MSIIHLDPITKLMRISNSIFLANIQQAAFTIQVAKDSLNLKFCLVNTVVFMGKEITYSLCFVMLYPTTN